MDTVLLGQSLISGLCSGGLYALTGLGLTLSWRYLRVVNLSQFAFITLAAYLFYELCGRRDANPVLVTAVLAAAFAAVSILQQAVIARFKVNEFASIMLTFGVVVVVEAMVQWVWSADPLRLEGSLPLASLPLGLFYVPAAEGGTLAAAVVLTAATHVWLRHTYTGKALRAGVDNPAVAEAFGVQIRRLSYVVAGLTGLFATIAGGCVVLVTSLSPSQIYAPFGVVFAAVLVGGLGSPLGLLGAGLLIGALEAGTAAFAAPTLAPLVSFSILILILILWPERL